MTITQLELENENLQRTLECARMKKQRIESLDRNRALREEIKKVKWDTIIEGSAVIFGVTPEAIKGRRRREGEVFARQTSAALIRELQKATTIEIGAFLGGRDHGTIIHACKAVKDRLETDPDFRFRFNAVKSLIMEAIQ